MRCNFVVCRTNAKGQEEFLESFVHETWTDVMYHAVSFRKQDFAEDVASFLANQLDQTIYARLRTKEEVR